MKKQVDFLSKCENSLKEDLQEIEEQSKYWQSQEKNNYNRAMLCGCQTRAISQEIFLDFITGLKEIIQND